MASLVNCQPVTKWISQEYPGDSPINGTLELQTPPYGVTLLSPDNPNYYFLELKPMPGYRINSTMMNIYNASNQAISELVGGSYTVTYPYGWPNGIQTYFVSLSAAASDYPDIQTIRIFDSLGENFNDCNNVVIIEIGLVPSFVMPESNYTIQLDFGGIAVLCEPSPPPPDPEDPVTGTAPFIYRNEVFVSNFYSTSISMWANDYHLYFAQWYESESYASSIYNLHNNSSYIGGYSPTTAVNVPPYDWLNTYQDYWPNYYNDGCLDSFQPTCYTGYKNTLEIDGFYNEPTTAAPNTISTLCGQLIAAQPTAMQLGGSNWSPDHPNNYLDVPPNYNNKCELDFRVEINESDLRYLSLIDYPTIEPGGPVIPNALSWYISIGDNPNYDLIANPSFIDVWKIVTYINNSNYTTVEVEGFNTYTPSSDIDCDFGNNIETFVSDSSENNSDLDLASKTIEYVDDKTIKLTIPFKTGLSISRFGPEDTNFFRRRNKIFVNVYPTEI
jgi:hypothetical protein